MRALHVKQCLAGVASSAVSSSVCHASVWGVRVPAMSAFGPCRGVARAPSRSPGGSRTCNDVRHRGRFSASSDDRDFSTGASELKEAQESHHPAQVVMCVAESGTCARPRGALQSILSAPWMPPAHPLTVREDERALGPRASRIHSRLLHSLGLPRWRRRAYVPDSG